MVSRITGSVGKGLAAITMDKEYQQKRREEMNRPPKDFAESLAKGGKGLLKVWRDCRPSPLRSDKGRGGWFRLGLQSFLLKGSVVKMENEIMSEGQKEKHETSVMFLFCTSSRPPLPFLFL